MIPDRPKSPIPVAGPALALLVLLLACALPACRRGLPGPGHLVPSPGHLK